MHADDELRNELVRERASRAQHRTADAVLSQLRPAMRRARRRRLAATTVAITVALSGLAAAAQVVRTDRTDTIRITSDDTPGAHDSDHDSMVDPDQQTAARPRGDSTGATTPDDQHTRSADDTPVEPPAASPHVESPSDDGLEITGPATDDDPPRPQTGPPPIAPATTAAAVPTTVAPTVTTTPTTPKPERFDSPCGYATAVRSTDSVDVVDIVPANGYDYHLEDRDHGDVAIQFSGAGEDCELKITTIGSDPSAD